MPSSVCTNRLSSGCVVPLSNSGLIRTALAPTAWARASAPDSPNRGGADSCETTPSRSVRDTSSVTVPPSGTAAAKAADRCSKVRGLASIDSTRCIRQVRSADLAEDIPMPCSMRRRAGLAAVVHADAATRQRRDHEQLPAVSCRGPGHQVWFGGRATRRTPRMATGLSDPDFCRIAEPRRPESRAWASVRTDSLRSPVRIAAVSGDSEPAAADVARGWDANRHACGVKDMSASGERRTLRVPHRGEDSSAAVRDSEASQMTNSPTRRHHR